MSVGITCEHRRLAAELVAEAKRHNGLAPVELERFHFDQQVSAADPFGEDIPQCPLGIWMTGDCVFDELGVKEDWWRYRNDAEWRLSLNRAYNDKAEKTVGRRLLSEKKTDTSQQHPAHKALHDVFEGNTVWRSGTLWLEQAAHNQEELEALLDRVGKRLENLRGFMLPDNWESEKERFTAQGGRTRLYRHQRGPVTFATSIYGVENLIFLLYDNPKLAERFRDLILGAMLGIARVLDEEAGFTPETAPRGFNFLDDNCALLTPEMYELFGYPILKGIFDRYSPDPGDRRFQHSDSDMAHIVPILGRLKLTEVNFGPTVLVDKIREYLPHALIRGVLAPFTFSRNEEENIVAEFLRDFEMARESRGLIFETAGAINNGSWLTGLRLIMAAIQKYGRYG